MGQLLKGGKRNLVSNKKNSFNIGFSKRSPFSYQLPSADPNSGVTQVNPPDMNDGTVERIQAQADATSSMLKTFSDVASTAIKEEKKKYSDQDIAQQKLDRKEEKLEKKKKRNITRELNKNRADGDPRVKRKDVTQKDIDNFDVSKQSESKQKRYKKLDDQVTKLETDIENKEYSDVSGADIERAEDEATVALSEWKKNNPAQVNKKTSSDNSAAILEACKQPAFRKAFGKCP